MLERITPSENLRQNMDKKKVMKLVVFTDENIMTMELDQQIEIFKKAIKERTFNHVELINPAKRSKLSRRERVLLDPLAASQR